MEKSFIKSKNIIFFVSFLILTFLMHFNIMASNIILSEGASLDQGLSPAMTHNDSSFESKILETEAVDDEAVREKYINEINEAYLSVKLPEVYNLPTQYIQYDDHPSDSDYFGKVSEESPIFRVEVDQSDADKKNCMCLTFDSAYINKYTYEILDILDKYNVKSTFFMTYEFMEKNPEQIMEIIKRGHEIGNHSNTHPDLNKKNDAAVIKEIMKPHNYMENLVGVDMCLFRFPFGSYSPRTVSILKNLGYYPIQWTLDSIDWKNSGKDFLINRFKDNEDIKEGSIILFHNGATYTPEALPEIIEMIHDKGLRCVKVSDLIYHHDFHVFRGSQIKGQFKFSNEE